MKKVIDIKGMTCSHCSRRVDKALNNLEGVKAKVNLKKNQATISYGGVLTDEVIKEAVKNAGYEVTAINEKKGFFS